MVSSKFEHNGPVQNMVLNIVEPWEIYIACTRNEVKFVCHNRLKFVCNKPSYTYTAHALVNNSY